ncbi:hypothetical protein [Bacillus velezensis]|uniref:hypothetical protein n=1 Tax=Bacillus velezensis TaxID=492670 RepID=UPI0034A5021F
MAKHAIKLCMKVVSMKLLHHAASHTKRYREIIVNENIHHFPGKRSIRQIKTNHKGTKVRYKEAACGFVVQIKFPFQKGRMFIRNFTFIPAECLKKKVGKTADFPNAN